jgi:hypothetical protein
VNVKLQERSGTEDARVGSRAGGRRRFAGRRGELLLALALVLVASVLVLLLGSQFLEDPTRLAPTRDPAWYTWRTQVLLADEPALLLEKEGPLNMLAGGYRVTTPVLGGLMKRVAGIDPYRFTIFFMVGIPILTALALGAFAYQHRRDPLLFLLTVFFAFGMLLTTPFVGYMDNLFVLYLLALALPFLEPARTSWGARSALALFLFLAALTHPSTTVFFCLILGLTAGLGWLANRFTIRKTLSAYGPTLISAAVGAIAGFLSWQLGLWGPSSSFSDAVLVQPYPREFFLGRLDGWWLSLRPRYTVPLAVIAIGWFAWRLVRRRGLDWHARISVLWLLPLIGVFGFVLDLTYPYYRFFNTSLALILLGGTGAWLITRGFRLGGRAVGDRWGVFAAVAAVIIVAGVFTYYVSPALRTWERDSQWVSRTGRVALAGARGYAAAEPDKPIVFVIHPKPERFRAWAIAKLNSNIMLAGLSGDQAGRAFVHVGTVEGLQRGRPTVSGFPVFDLLSREFLKATQEGVGGFSEPPMVFLVKGFNAIHRAEVARPGTDVTPEVRLLEGDGWAEPSAPAIAAARQSRAETLRELAPKPRLGDVPHLAQVFLGVGLLLLVPGLLAWRWFGLRGLPTMVAMVPGLSLGLVMFSAIVVIAVHRAPFGTADGVAAMALALVASGTLGMVSRRSRRSEAAGQTGAEGPAGVAPSSA